MIQLPEPFSLLVAIVQKLLPKTASTFSFTLDSLRNIVRELRHSSPSYRVSSIMLCLELRRECTIELGIGAVNWSFKEYFLQNFQLKQGCSRNLKHTIITGAIVPIFRWSSVRINPGCTDYIVSFRLVLHYWWCLPG